jgi:hypothetical protein
VSTHSSTALYAVLPHHYIDTQQPGLAVLFYNLPISSHSTSTILLNVPSGTSQRNYTPECIRGTNEVNYAQMTQPVSYTNNRHVWSVSSAQFTAQPHCVQLVSMNLSTSWVKHHSATTHQNTSTRLKVLYYTQVTQQVPYNSQKTHLPCISHTFYYAATSMWV